MNLKINWEGIYKCHGCLQRDYPVIIPHKSVLAEKLLIEAHLQTILGGMTLTMTKIRDQCWIPTARQLVKRIITSVTSAKYSTLVIFQNHLVVGTDYARLFIYKTKGKRDIKFHLLLINCSLTRVVHPEILLNQTTQEFIQTLKQLIARRDRPKIIYSDNAKHLRKLQSRSRKFSKTRECNIF